MKNRLQIHLGGLLKLRNRENRPKRLQDRPKRVPRRPQRGPERQKRGPGGSQECSEDTSKGPWGAIWNAIGQIFDEKLLKFGVKSLIN